MRRRSIYYIRRTRPGSSALCGPRRDNPVFAAQRALELVMCAAHVPIAGDQPHGAELCVGRASAGLPPHWSGYRPTPIPRSTQHLSSFALPPNAPRQVRLGHRRVGAGDQQAPGLAVAQDIDRMFDPPLPPVTTTAASRPLCRGWRRLAQREGEDHEAERIEQQEQGAEAGDHNASRNAASTAMRATQVARTVSASGKSSSRTRSRRRQDRAAGRARRQRRRRSRAVAR